MSPRPGRRRVVQKYGGTSVGSPARIKRVAERIAGIAADARVAEAGPALARRVGVEGAHELPAGIHQVEIGTMVHHIVVDAGSCPMWRVIGAIFLSHASNLRSGAGQPDDPRIK